MQADALLMLERFEDCAAAWRALLALPLPKPLSSLAHSGAGHALMMLEDRKALDHLEAALNSDTRFPAACMRIWRRCMRGTAMRRRLDSTKRRRGG
jgi:hypothetical protein